MRQVSVAHGLTRLVGEPQPELAARESPRQDDDRTVSEPEEDEEVKQPRQESEGGADNDAHANSDRESEITRQEKHAGASPRAALGSKRARGPAPGGGPNKRLRLDQEAGDDARKNLDLLYSLKRREEVELVKNQPIVAGTPQGAVGTRAQVAAATGGKDGRREVGEMYGEITRQSAAAVLEKITSRRKLKSGAAFVDLGCGVGNILFHAAIAHPGITCTGYEIQDGTYLAFQQLDRLLKDQGLDLGVKVTHTDICAVEQLPAEATHVYAWSSRFGAASICAVARLFERGSARTLMFASPAKDAVLHGLQRARQVGEVKVRSQGGEQFTLYLYEKVPQADIARQVRLQFEALPKDRLGELGSLAKF